MNDQPVKSRSSRDAELEALRQKSLVGTQRASLGSAVLPEGMTLDKWMMQQRNFTEEERRKRNDAAKFLHSYRGKNVPVGTTPPSKMTPNRLEHIPPGPDEQQVTEIPNADIKGIVAEFEKITTATTTTTASPSRIIASDSTRMTSTTTAHDGGGASESRGEQINTTNTMEENFLEEEIQQDNSKEISTLYATREQQEDSSTAQLMILTDSPTIEEKEAAEEEEAVESSNLPNEEKEEEELSTADEQGPVSSTNEESWKVVEDATLEQILPLDEPTNTLREENKPRLPLKNSREDPQATLTPQPQNNQIVTSDLQLGMESIDTTTTTTPTAINDYTTTIDHPILAPKQKDLSPRDERFTNNQNNNNNNIIMMSRPTEEVNEGPRHDDNNNNQSTPKVGSTKKVDVKVLLAVHVKKADADAVLSGGKQSILDSVIHVTENIVKKTIASSTLLDATGTFYNPTFRPTIDSVEADGKFHDDLIIPSTLCIWFIFF